MDKEKKITNIKYKQMDRDPEIKKVTNEMEKLFFGEKGIGLMGQLGLNPGKIQKSLDDQWEKEFETMLEENQDYIFWESRKRAAEYNNDWLKELKISSIPEEELKEQMEKSIKKAELEVIKELVEKHL